MVQTASVVRRAPSSNGLYDVVDLILDKGLVIDAYLRVSLVGIEILTVDLRVVIASVDTYLRFAEAVDRLALQEQGGKTLDELIAGGNGRVSSGGGDGREVERGDDERGRGPVRKVVDAVTPGNDEDKE